MQALNSPVDIATLEHGCPTSDPRDVVDWDQLLVLREYQEPGEPDIVTDLVMTFLDDATVRMDRLRKAASAADFAVVRLEAHTLKGSAATLFAERLRVAAGDVEQAATGDGPALAPLVERLASDLNALRGALAHIPAAS